MAQHAHAARTQLELDYRDGTLRVEVRDEGPGFDLAATAGHGTGLIGIADRIGTAGGDVVVESTPGRGTLIRVSVPAVPTA